jgi:hypothetical protein
MSSSWYLVEVEECNVVFDGCCGWSTRGQGSIQNSKEALAARSLSLSHGVEGLLETSEKPIAQSSFSESVFSRADPAL